MKRVLSALLVLVVLGGCGTADRPAIEVSAVRILEPLPGGNAGVAYLTVRNNGDAVVTIQSARSPQFARVEMHESIIEDGISKMRPLGAVSIQPGEAVRFEPGGRHFMMMGAESEIGPGTPVTLELAHTGGLLVVSATMQARLAAE